MKISPALDNLSSSIKGPSINDVTALGGRRYQGFCDNSAKSVTMWEGVSRIIKNYVTSFIDNPIVLLIFLENFKFCLF
jgi:hypothetical protein